MKLLSTSSVVGMTIVLLVACSNEAKRVYEESTYGPPLEVPPDLTVPRGDETLDVPQARPPSSPAPAKPTPGAASLPVLPTQEMIRVERDGAQRWLVLQGSPEQLWPWVRDFWFKKGFELEIEDSGMGVLETTWKQQRQNLPQAGVEVKKAEAKVYAVPVRDKYRARLEQGQQAGTTELYLTHRAVELIPEGKMIAWKLRGSEPEMEADMLKQLVTYLGIEQGKAGGLLTEKAERISHAALIKNAEGRPVLKVDYEFPRVWRRTGFILDRLNFLIEDSNRPDGIYYVRAKHPVQDATVDEEKGWFARLFSKADDEPERFQLSLRDEGEATHITLRTQEGKYAADEKAEAVLKQLLEQLQ